MHPFPHDYKSPMQKCIVRVDDVWYDLSTWRFSHPGGAEFLDNFHEKDATETFYSMHSKDAISRLKKIKGKPVSDADQKKKDKVYTNFEILRKQFEAEGYMKRNWILEFFCYMLPCVSWCVIGTILAPTYPVLATLFLALGMQQAGWVAHDYVHGNQPGSAQVAKFFGSCINGFAWGWWGTKHNGWHHCFPNRKGFDTDIHNEPILHLWLPDPDKDVWYRRYQHHYFLIAYSFLFASWRMQSLTWAFTESNWVERILIALNYIWIACLPWKVAIGAILLSGFLAAAVVTVNHQPEPMIEKDAEYNFVADTFNTTRSVDLPDWFTNYFYGGLQYQLEHHLFPTIPKQYYQEIRPRIKKFAEENGLPFKLSPLFTVLKMNYDVMKANSVRLEDAKKQK